MLSNASASGTLSSFSQQEIASAVQLTAFGRQRIGDLPVIQPRVQAIGQFIALVGKDAVQRAAGLGVPAHQRSDHAQSLGI